MTEDVVYEYKSQNVMISDVDLHSVLSETDVEDDWDDDSLTTVTSLDNMSILDGKLPGDEFPQMVDNKKVKICVVRMIIKCTLTFIDCD